MKNIHSNKIILTIVLLFTNTFIFSQINEIRIDNTYNNLNWAQFVNKLETEKEVNLYFQTDSIPDIQIIVFENNLLKTLNSNFSKYNINISVYKNNIFLLRNEKLQTELPTTFFTVQNYIQKENEHSQIDSTYYLHTNNEYIDNIKIVGKKTLNNKSTATISGYVKNASDGNPIIGCTMYFKEQGIGTVTNNTGYYSIKLNKGEHILTINSLETGIEKYKIIVYSDGNLNFEIAKKIIALDEVLVTADRYDNVRSTGMGFEKLSTAKISEIPLVLGEKDIIKVSLLLPGITTVGEGSAGFNVRGSPADQNLFYINKVPIYNTSHLLGFFSAFNSDAINEFTLYKSNIPAKYGGRLSSIFEIKTKQGNKNKYTASGGISPITGRLLLEGPIVKDKATFILSFRSTYSDWILDLIKSPEINNSTAKFSDFIGNINVNLNKKNNFKLFSYYSTDKINLTGTNLFDYENTGAGLTWERIVNKKHKFSTDFIYSKYNYYSENTEEPILANKSDYKIQHFEIKSFINFYFNKHEIVTGINSVYYLIDQGSFLPLNDSSIVKPIFFNTENAIENSLFISDDWKISNKISIIAGFRINNYLYLSKNSVYEYKADVPKSIANIIDTLNFSNNQIIKTYTNPDFRLGAKFLITDNISIKAGFNTLHQYIFMLSNTIAISPTYKWKLTDYHIEPLSGSQFSLGFFTNFFSDKIEFSVESYYKKIKNLVEYKDGANLQINKIPELDILQGNLNSYGIEFMLKKPFGKLNGWLNYTYSSAKVTVNSQFEEERINFGNPYPANYHKPHSVNFVANIKLSRRISFSTSMVYSTGRPITLPVAVFYQNNMKLLHYSDRNEYKVPDYFRIDLSLKVEGNLKSKKLAHGTWLFSIYNLTGRNNAYSVYFKADKGNIQGYKMSVFAIPVFSISYNFKLGNYAD